MRITPQDRRLESWGDLSADAALRRFADEHGPAVGFCYRPRDTWWFRLDGTAVPVGPDGQARDLTGVFELRAFTPNHELRWRNHSGGTGPAVVVSDQPGASPRSARRLLWGVSTGWRDGWVTLGEARIGSLMVPLDTEVACGDHVAVELVEYTYEDGHGNVSVVDERLVRLVAVGSVVPGVAA